MSAAPAPAARLAGRALQAGFAIALLLVWYAVTVTGLVNRIILPNPVLVIGTLPAVVTSPDFLVDFGTTCFEVAVGFAIAAVAGILLGYVVSRSVPRVREYEPLLSALYAIPVVLFYPLVVLLLGIGPASKIAMGVSASFFPIVLSAIAGFGGVDKVHIAAARTMGATNVQLLRWVLLPSALPIIATGLRMGLIVTLLATLGTETLGSISGLGYRMMVLTEEMETAQVYAYIVIIIALAVVLNAFVSWLGRKAQTRGGGS